MRRSESVPYPKLDFAYQLRSKMMVKALFGWVLNSLIKQLTLKQTEKNKK